MTTVPAKEPISLKTSAIEQLKELVARLGELNTTHDERADLAKSALELLHKKEPAAIEQPVVEEPEPAKPATTKHAAKK